MLTSYYVWNFLQINTKGIKVSNLGIGLVVLMGGRQYFILLNPEEGKAHMTLTRYELRM